MEVDKEGKKGSDDEDDWWESMMPKLPEPKKSKKKRKYEDEDLWVEKDKYTEEEMKVLVEEVTKREEAIFGEYKEDETPSNRWRMWVEVADKVNDISIKYRSPEQVRLRWFQHKDPKHRFCTYKKTMFCNQFAKPATQRRYWHIRKRLSVYTSRSSNMCGDNQSVNPPQPITPQAISTSVPLTIPEDHNSYTKLVHNDRSSCAAPLISNTSEDQSASCPQAEPLERDKIQDKTASCSNAEPPGSSKSQDKTASCPHVQPLRSDKNKDKTDKSTEEVMIIDEVPSKDPNRKYEVIDIDDENSTNEGTEPRGTALKKDSSNPTKGPITQEEIDEWEKFKQLPEDDRVKKWMRLSDKERKERVQRILDNLRVTPKQIPPRPKPSEKPKPQHFTIVEYAKGVPTFVASSKNATPSGVSGVSSVTSNVNSSSINSSGSHCTNPKITEKGSGAPSGTSNASSSNINSSGSRCTGPKITEKVSGAPSGTSNASLSNINSSGSRCTGPKITEKVSEVPSVISNLKSSNINSSGSHSTNPKITEKVSEIPSVISSLSSSNVDSSGSHSTVPKITEKVSGVTSIISNVSSSNVDSFGSISTNPTESNDASPSVSHNKNPSGSSEMNVPESGDSNPSPSGSHSVKSCGSSSPSISSIGKITEVHSLGSSNEFQNLPSPNTILSKMPVTVPERSIDKLTSQQSSSNTGLSNDSTPYSTNDLSHFIGVPSAHVQNFRIIPPVGTNSSDVLALIPVYKQRTPQSSPKEIVITQIAGQVMMGKESDTVKDATNVKESNSGVIEDSSKECMSSSTIIDEGSELLREIFGFDATSNIPTFKSEQPVAQIQNSLADSDVRMEIGNASEGNLTSDSNTSITDMKQICSDNSGADITKDNNYLNNIVMILSESSSIKKTEPFTSKGSTKDKQNEMAEKRMKVYSGKKALQKKVMHSGTGLIGNKRKQILQASVIIDLTDEGNASNSNSPNSDGYTLESQTLIEIKDPITGKTFFLPKKQPQNLQVEEEKSKVHARKEDNQNKPSNLTSNKEKMKKSCELKQYTKKAVKKIHILQPLLPKTSPVCIIQGDTIQMPPLQNRKTSKMPLLLRQNVSKPSSTPVTLVALPPEVHASTSGIENKSEVSLKPIQQPGIQQPVPVALLKARDGPLKLIQQSSILRPVPVSIHKAGERPAIGAVASQKIGTNATVKSSPTVAVVPSVGRNATVKGSPTVAVVPSVGRNATVKGSPTVAVVPSVGRNATVKSSPTVAVVPSVGRNATIKGSPTVAVVPSVGRNATVKGSPTVTVVPSVGRKKQRKDLGDLRTAALLSQPVVMLDRLPDNLDKRKSF